MIKRILLAFFLLQFVVAGAILWMFAGGLFSWAQEAWRRGNEDKAQYCFDVIRESSALERMPAVKWLGAEESGDHVRVHYRIEQSGGRFQERVYECQLIDGQIDKTAERQRMLSKSFSDIDEKLR